MNRDQDDKRERVLTAAQECFTLYGFKRTAMDDIAQKAAISRAALYLLFPNKEAIFRTLAEELHHEALSRAETALRAAGTLAERLVAAFEGKDLELMALVQSSAHGAELVDLKHRIGADIAEQAENRFKELLTQALHQAERQGELTFDRIGLEANQCAELLLLAAHGLKQPACSLALYRQRLAQLIQVFCAATAVG
ncbi:MAG: TetR/AcrR family transcriptional regulator [Chloroflexota bacterium]